MWVTFNHPARMIVERANHLQLALRARFYAVGMNLRRGVALGAYILGTASVTAIVTAQIPSAVSPAGAGEQTVSLSEAIRKAEINEPGFRTTEAESRALALERTNARAALLPNAAYHNQVIYTQPNGESSRIGQTAGAPTPVFIANNAIREYASQGVFNEVIGFQQIGVIRQVDAAAARAAAEAEVARRGLVATVVESLLHVWIAAG